jgi:hypothetical protein
MTAVAVYIEQGAQRCFACSVDWPGLCRSGKGEEAALAALDAHLPRYVPVVKEAGFGFPRPSGVEWEVVATVPTRSGGADFGAPTAITDFDRGPFTPAELGRFGRLLSASWAYLDRVVAGAPEELRKGPRGGGRDTSAIAAHVSEAERQLAAKVGVKPVPPPPADQDALQANREAVLQACLSGARPAPGSRATPWPPRYALRRLTWHVLDHAWEIEDRSP